MVLADLRRVLVEVLSTAKAAMQEMALSGAAARRDAGGISASDGFGPLRTRRMLKATPRLCPACGNEVSRR